MAYKFPTLISNTASSIRGTLNEQPPLTEHIKRSTDEKKLLKHS